MAPCWCTGVGSIRATHALKARQLCKISSFEIHAPARRSSAQKCEADAAGMISARVLAISRRYMMNAGGSAVERLIFGTTAAGAAIGACVTTMSAATIFGRKGPLCPRPLPLGGVLPRPARAASRAARRRASTCVAFLQRARAATRGSLVVASRRSE